MGEIKRILLTPIGRIKHTSTVYTTYVVSISISNDGYVAYATNILGVLFFIDGAFDV